ASAIEVRFELSAFESIESGGESAKLRSIWPLSTDRPSFQYKRDQAGLSDAFSLNVSAKNKATSKANADGINQIIGQFFIPFTVNASTIFPPKADPSPIPTP